ncbi:MAG: metal-dependent hydrolase [Proteobacteria bacterium]|nr:metal-dependent hydrolase [Pseudomonadota bacterium]
MDSLTQIVLGASVGVAVLGRRLGPRRAAIAGGILGTLPDLDILIRYDDPVDNFLLHRGWSHSLVVQAVLTPLFGEAMVRFITTLRQQRPATYLAVYLCLATHALLDALTVYGTRLLWPLWPEPFAVSSVFIIDPLYTLPLLVATVWALCLGHWTRRIRTVVTVGLALSTAYQGWCITAQQIATGRARAMLDQAGVTPRQMLVVPTPFNSYLWRALALQDDRYLNLYLPVFGGAEQATSYVHPRGMSMAGCLGENSAFGKLARFSRGYYRLDLRQNEIVFSDLRMGLTPSYVFRYAIAAQQGDSTAPIPPRRLGGSRGGQADIDWLLANLLHDPAIRPAEGATRIDIAALVPPPGAKKLAAVKTAAIKMLSMGCGTPIPPLATTLG